MTDLGARKMMWTPLEASNFADPYPMYANLRANDPVHRAQTGEWVVTKYHDIMEVLRDNRFLAGNRQEWLQRGVEHLRNRGMDFQAIIEAMSTFVLNMNPPDHTRIRQFISEAWVNRHLQTTIADNINALLDPINDKEFDFVASFSSLLPTKTACSILGVNVKSYKEMKELGSAMIKALDPYTTLRDFVRINKASKDFIEFFTLQVEEKSQNPKDDLISSIILENRRTGQSLTNSELVSICIFLFVAGEETTASFMSTAVLNLLTFPNELEKLRRGEVTYERAFDELIRYDSPVHLIGRLASEKLELGGKEISKGEVVTLCLASANRDEDIFDDGNKLDLGRPQQRHLAFGYGIHYCLGDWLARMQGQMALKAVLEAYPNLVLPDQPLRWRGMLAVRGLTKLIVGT